MRSIFIRTSALLSVLANDIQTSTDGKAGARMTGMTGMTGMTVDKNQSIRYPAF